MKATEYEHPRTAVACFNDGKVTSSVCLPGAGPVCALCSVRYQVVRPSRQERIDTDPFYGVNGNDTA